MEPKDFAAQLRKPSGEEGLTMGERMNESNAAMNRNVYSLADAKENDKILEIGFGNGKFIPELANKASNIFYAGVDFSETMVKEAEKRNSELVSQGKVKFHLSSIAAIPYPENYFDKACTINTLYFWENPLQDAKEVLRVLKPGGKFFIGIRPKEEASQFPFTKFGFTLYSGEEACELLRKAGFSEVSYSTIADPPIKFQEKELHFHTLCIVAGKQQ